jgi:hypothetical protein
MILDLCKWDGKMACNVCVEIGIYQRSHSDTWTLCGGYNL